MVPELPLLGFGDLRERLRGEGIGEQEVNSDFEGMIVPNGILYVDSVLDVREIGLFFISVFSFFPFILLPVYSLM